MRSLSTSRQVARERPDLEFVGLIDPVKALAQVEAAAPDVLVTDEGLDSDVRRLVSSRVGRLLLAHPVRGGDSAGVGS